MAKRENKKAKVQWTAIAFLIVATLGAAQGNVAGFRSVKVGQEPRISCVAS